VRILTYTYSDNNFDTPLTGSQAYSLAAPMIKDCPASSVPVLRRR